MVKFKKRSSIEKFLVFESFYAIFQQVSKKWTIYMNLKYWLTMTIKCESLNLQILYVPCSWIMFITCLSNKSNMSYKNHRAMGEKPSYLWILVLIPKFYQATRSNVRPIFMFICIRKKSKRERGRKNESIAIILSQLTVGFQHGERRKEKKWKN